MQGSGEALSDQSFRERYEHLTDEEIWRIVDVRKDLVPEAASALDREIERRHLKRRLTPLLTSDPYLFAIAVALILVPLVIWLAASGRSMLVYPVMVTVVAISSVIWVSWDLKRYVWFWTTMGSFVLLHTLFILVLPWQAGWLPAVATSLACVVDLGIMFGVIGLFERLNKKQDKSSS